MRTRLSTRRHLAIALACCALATGCSSGKKKPNSAELKWNATRASVLLSLADEQYRNGQLDRCRTTLDQAMTLNTDDERLHVLTAKVALEEGRLDRAEASLDYATTLQPTLPEAHYLKGVLTERWQQPEQALAHYQEAARLAPNDPAYLLAVAELLAELGQVDEAVAQLSDRVIYFETSAAIRVALGRLLVGQGKHELAVEYLRQATLMDQGDLEAKEELALALFSSGRWTEASDRLDALVGMPAYHNRTDLLIASARCSLELGRPVQARDTALRATELRRDDLDAYLLLAEAATQADDNRRAEMAMARAQNINGADPRAYLLEGYLRLRQGRLEEAMTAFRNSSERDPRCAVSLCMIGYVLQRSGQPDRAAYYYRQAHAIDPQDPLAATLVAGVETTSMLD